MSHTTTPLEELRAAVERWVYAHSDEPGVINAAVLAFERTGYDEDGGQTWNAGYVSIAGSLSNDVGLLDLARDSIIRDADTDSDSNDAYREDDR